MAERRLYRGALALLCLLNLVWVWGLEVFPAQDLPQHLAYVRILRDYDDPGLPYQRLYRLPERFQSYFTPYYLLAALARATSVEVALRLVLSLWVVAMFAAFHLLVAAVHPEDRGPPWAALLAPLLLWGPCFAMGFLQYFLALPPLLLAAAALLRWSRGGEARWWPAAALASAALVASIHLVAAGALLLFGLLLAVFGRPARRWLPALATAGALALAVGLWSGLGEAGIGEPGKLEFADAARAAHGLEFLNTVFRITWQDPLVKTSYALWTAFGPYRWNGQIWTALALAAVAAVAWSAGRGQRPAPAWGPARRTALAFAVAAWLLPWGIEAPSEATFVDFRLFTPAWALLLALWPAPRRAAREVRWAVIAAALLVTVQFGVRARGFAAEARPAVGLLEAAQPPGMLMSLPFHNRSSHFGKQFRLTHFLPMYYTVRHAGLNAQFWGRYVHHLPIDYRDRPPVLTPDWYPWQFETAHLADSDFLLVQWPTPDSSPRYAAAARRAQPLLEGAVWQVRCAAEWCLYRVVEKPPAGGAVEGLAGGEPGE